MTKHKNNIWIRTRKEQLHNFQEPESEHLSLSQGIGKVWRHFQQFQVTAAKGRSKGEHLEEIVEMKS